MCDAVLTLAHLQSAGLEAMDAVLSSSDAARRGCARPVGLGFRAAKLSTNADNPEFETTTR